MKNVTRKKIQFDTTVEEITVLLTGNAKLGNENK